MRQCFALVFWGETDGASDVNVCGKNGGLNIVQEGNLVIRSLFSSVSGRIQSSLVLRGDKKRFFFLLFFFWQISAKDW